MENKLTTKQMRALETKRKIYDKALELFKNSDYEKVSTTDICKSLNISVGNFYKYYKSKEELLLESYPSFDIYIETKFWEEKFDSNIEAIRYLIFKQTHDSEVYGANLYLQLLKAVMKTRNEEVFENRRAFNTCLIQLIQNAIKEGELVTECSADDISEILLHISRNSLLQWSLQNSSYSVSERTLHYIDIFLNSLKGN